MTRPASPQPGPLTRLMRAIARAVDRVRRENLHRILISLVALSLLSAFALSVIEPETSFYDWLWWSCVTLTTVGYGDVTPSTPIGRVVGIILMFLGIGVLSSFTALIAGMLVEMRLRQERGMTRTDLDSHIILCGWNARAQEILRELRDDPVAGTTPIVLIAELDARPTDDELLVFVHGTVDEESLAKASIDTARTVILLGDDRLDASARDAKVVLGALTVESLRPEVHTICELARESNAQHCRRARADEVVVADEVSSRLIAAAACGHGLTGVMSDLLSRAGRNQLKKMPAPREWIGRTFLDLLTGMKRANGSTVVAVEQQGSLITNPDADLTIGADDALVVIAPVSASA
ncbi:MAG: ion channel [Acidobacteriota bacterium]